MRIRDLAPGPWLQPCGLLNQITDVPGVRVGHASVVGPCEANGRAGYACTGVTAVIPQPGNLFRHPVTAAVHVINGFGKAIGLTQVGELGRIETPIILTNTLCAARAADALVGYMLEQDPDIGLGSPTVNPVVLECNDGYLNSIRVRAIDETHVRKALETAAERFDQGAVGAGTGMTAFGWKGGIGSASRRIQAASGECVLGILALTNFGRSQDLCILGVPVGRSISPSSMPETGAAGSVVVVLATDAPLDARQLARVARRCETGLARAGSYHFHGSGDFVVAFSTAGRAEHWVDDSGPWLDPFFRAAADATEESVYDSLLAADTTLGRDGHSARSLSEMAEQLQIMLGSYGKMNRFGVNGP